jgi:putative transposase
LRSGVGVPERVLSAGVPVGRLWRTVKYEDIYLRDYASPVEARRGLERYFGFYNEERPH